MVAPETHESTSGSPPGPVGHAPATQPPTPATPPGTTPGPVFICHSTTDRALAERIYDQLRRSGLPAWICSRDIPGSADWGTAIVEAIERCSLLLLLYSRNAVGADWVKDELREARDARRPILPVLLGETSMAQAKDVRLMVGGRQWLHLSERPDETELATRLVPAVRDALAGGAGIPVHSAMPKKHRRSPWLVGAGAGVVTLGSVLLAVTLTNDPPPPPFRVIVQAPVEKMGITANFEIDEGLQQELPVQTPLEFYTHPKLTGSTYLLYIGPDGAAALDPADPAQMWHYRSGSTPGTVTALVLHFPRPLKAEVIENLKKRMRAAGPAPALPIGVNIEWSDQGARYVEDPSRSGLPVPEFPREWTSIVLSELRSLNIRYAGRSFPIGSQPRN